MTQPVALGFTEGLTALDELKMRVAAGHHDFAIMLGGGAISRKTIHHQPGEPLPWHIVNHIDETDQSATDTGLWSGSHIGVALDRRALLDMDGDLPDPKVEAAIAEAKAAWIKARAERDPLRLVMRDGPGAIRMGEDADVDWEPANPVLVLETCDIGPHTVAQIDLAAVCMGFMDDGCAHAATTSIELTIEDMDDMIATLTALREDAVANRGFAMRADGWWSNGEE